MLEILQTALSLRRVSNLVKPGILLLGRFSALKVLLNLYRSSLSNAALLLRSSLFSARLWNPKTPLESSSSFTWFNLNCLEHNIPGEIGSFTYERLKMIERYQVGAHLWCLLPISCERERSSSPESQIALKGVSGCFFTFSPPVSIWT